jgi:hypothetical protein
MIEVAHENTKLECARAIEIFLSTGSHFLTNADWGCPGGEHKAWFTMDANNKNEAIMVVPPALRHRTKITELARFSMKDAVEMMKDH